MKRVLCVARGFTGLKENAPKTLVLLPHAQPAAECEAALSAQTSICLCTFRCCCPTPATATASTTSTKHLFGIEIAIAPS
jgi:hypothetical protein